jgi:hypothetical protein
MYILRNIDEVVIRQAGEKELNKMEHINKFSKAVFNENNHVMQQETREMQLVADGCRRLIQNNIIGSAPVSTGCRYAGRKTTGSTLKAAKAVLHGRLVPYSYGW